MLLVGCSRGREMGWDGVGQDGWMHAGCFALVSLILFLFFFGFLLFVVA